MIILAVANGAYTVMNFMELGDIDLAKTITD